MCAELLWSRARTRGRLQAALTDAVEHGGKPVSRRSIDSPHASRHSLGAAAVDGDEKADKAAAPYKDAQVCFIEADLYSCTLRSHHSGFERCRHGATASRVSQPLITVPVLMRLERCARWSGPAAAPPPSLLRATVLAGESGDVPAAAVRIAGLAVYGHRRRRERCDRHTGVKGSTLCPESAVSFCSAPIQ